jgi:hypothetical protein
MPFCVTEADETIPISGRDWLHQRAAFALQDLRNLRARACPPMPNICSWQPTATISSVSLESLRKILARASRC